MGSPDERGEWKAVVTGRAGEGAWAGIACYEDGLCLAGLRTDNTPGGARIRRSTDSGMTWSDDLPISGAESARAYYFARNGPVVLAGGGAAAAGRGALPNIFRSTDGGSTWSTVAFAETIRRLRFASGATGVYTILHLGNGHFIAGLEGAPLIIGSQDNGMTWEEVQTLTGSISVRRLYHLGRGIFLAAAIGSGIWRSVNNGREWVKIQDSPPHVFSIHDAGDGNWLAGTVGNGGDREVFRSTDDGDTWDQVAVLNAKSDFTYIRTFLSTSDGRVYAFVAGNEYEQRQRALATWLSKDRGMTWKKVKNPYTGPYGELHAVYDVGRAADGTFIMGTQPDKVILKGRY